MKLFIVLLVTILISQSSAMVVGSGSCPDVPAKRNFEMRKFIGSWYEVESFPSPWYLQDSSCVSMNLTTQRDSSIEISKAETGEWFGSKSVSRGSVLVPDNSAPGILSVRYSRWTPASEYKIIATDYRNFALVYSCNNYYVGHTEYAWVLSRSRGQIDSRNNKRINKIMRLHGLDKSLMVDTDHTNCS